MGMREEEELPKIVGKRIYREEDIPGRGYIGKRTYRKEDILARGQGIDERDLQRYLSGDP